MIKFKIESGKKKIIGLGLSYLNLERLKDGQPIIIKFDELGIDIGWEIFIMAGETEQTLTKDLSGFIGPNTDVIEL